MNSPVPKFRAKSYSDIGTEGSQSMSSRRTFRMVMAKANIPQDVRAQFSGNEEKYHLPQSQKMLNKGEHVCMCPVLQHCPLMATLHVPPCTFCHGLPKAGDPKISRYYPSDKGWWTLRHQVIRMRQVAGMEQIKEVTPYCEHY